MKTTYTSKVDAWLLVVIIVCLLPIFTLLYSELSIISVLVAVFTLVTVCVPVFSIRYVVGDGELIIKWGFIVSQRYPINSIRSIRRTHTMLSAPAASLDRLEICFEHDSVIVSPKRKLAFIDQLQELAGGRILVKL